VTARISLDLPTFLQMPWNMAQRQQTLFPAALTATPTNTGNGSGSRDYAMPQVKQAHTHTLYMKATLTMPLVTRDPCTTQNVLVLGHNIPNHARYTERHTKQIFSYSIPPRNKNITRLI